MNATRGFELFCRWAMAQNNGGDKNMAAQNNNSLSDRPGGAIPSLLLFLRLLPVCVCLGLGEGLITSESFRIDGVAN